MIRRIGALTLALGGCGGLCQQDDVTTIAVPVGSRLNAIDLGQDGVYRPVMVAAGDEGLILVARDGDAWTEHRPVTVDLRSVCLGPSGQIFAAGAGGTLVRGILGETSWTTVETGTNADLWSVARLSIGTASIGGSSNVEYVLAVGDEVVLVRDPVDAGWDLVPPPAGGWGRLRVAVGDDRIHVAGLGGVAWSAAAPEGPWRREDTGTEADLLGGDNGWGGEPVLVGAGGTVLHRVDGAWARVSTDIEADLIAYSWTTALTADGHLYDLGLLDEPERFAWTAVGARALVDDLELVVVGEALAVRGERYCGR